MPTPSVDGTNRRLLVRVATALHEAGAPSYRIEDTVAGLGTRFGIETAVFAVPTGLTIGLGPLDDQLVRIIRTQPRGPSLERLRLVNDVVAAVSYTHLTLPTKA